MLIFCNISKMQKRKKQSDNQKVHFKLSIFKYFYAEFDYEIKNNEETQNDNGNRS